VKLSETVTVRDAELILQYNCLLLRN